MTRVIDYERLYRYRFRDVDKAARQRVWSVISKDIYLRMNEPHVVLDPAAGTCEFISTVPAAERWAVDRVMYEPPEAPDIKFIVADILEAVLPDDHFDGIFVSNLLEHLPTQDAVADVLCRLGKCLKARGRLAVMGPNFKYCAREYFDCADHTLALTHVAVEEHLFAAGLNPIATQPRYLPYSFRGILPPSPMLTGLFLKLPPAQRLLGKQFLVMAEKA